MKRNAKLKLRSNIKKMTRGREAVDLVNGYSEYKLGCLLAKGAYGINPDPIKAYAWLTIAEQLGFTQATEQLKSLSTQFTPPHKAKAQQLTLELVNHFGYAHYFC